MFLFTHADQIKDVPESLDGAKKSLLEEIVQIIHGTNDNEVNDLLFFIRKCLEKDYSFVEVVHPLKSDYSMIANFIENNLKVVKVSSGSKNGSCSFTNSSLLRLSGAISKTMGELRCLFKTDDANNAKQICEIQKIFYFFPKCPIEKA